MSWETEEIGLGVLRYPDSHSDSHLTMEWLDVEQLGQLERPEPITPFPSELKSKKKRLAALAAIAHKTYLETQAEHVACCEQLIEQEAKGQDQKTVLLAAQANTRPEQQKN